MARASFRQDSGSTATARSDWTSLTLTRNSSVLQYTFGKYPAFIHKGKVMSLNKTSFRSFWAMVTKYSSLSRERSAGPAPSALANLFP